MIKTLFSFLLFFPSSGPQLSSKCPLDDPTRMGDSGMHRRYKVVALMLKRKKMCPRSKVPSPDSTVKIVTDVISDNIKASFQSGEHRFALIVVVVDFVLFFFYCFAFKKFDSPAVKDTSVAITPTKHRCVTL